MANGWIGTLHRQGGSPGHTLPVSPAPSPQPSRTPPVPSLSIAATGDVTLGSGGSYPDGGAAALLKAAHPYLNADLVIGNLETTLGHGRTDKCRVGATTCFAFQAPESYARGLRRSGFTLMNLANNHFADYGKAGQVSTVRALDAAGIRWTGPPGHVTYVSLRGIEVAVVGFSPYPWAQDLLDVGAAEALVRAAASRAALVIVTMHIGAEGVQAAHVRPGPETYLGEPRGDPLAFTHAVVAAGADLVLGSGPHVVRGMQWHRGRLIAFSLGNFSGHRTLGVSGDLGVGAVLKARLTADGRFLSGRVIPIRLLGAGTPAYDRAHAAWSLIGRLSRSDFGRTAVKLDSSGRLNDDRAW